MTAMDMRDVEIQYDFSHKNAASEQTMTSRDRYFSINTSKSGWMGEREKLMSEVLDMKLSFRW